jgi:hypothetical protein
MNKKLPRSKHVTFVLGAAIITFYLPCSTYAQSPTPQTQQAVQGQSQSQGSQNNQDRQPGPGDDITRRDLARFDQFLDSHRETAEQLRKTPSLIDDPQFLQGHPALNTYLQDHPSVKQEISQQPDSFMRAEDLYRHDRSLRDRDADGQYRDASQDRNAGGQNRDAGQDRDADRRDVASLNRFLDDHREIAEQVRRDPSLLDNRTFVQNHPQLQAYLQENPGVRDQLRQDPNALMHQEVAYNRDANMRDHDPMQDHMADFGGFLHNHSDIQRELSRDPSVVKDHDYMQNHTELEAYLNNHPDVRGELMSDPNRFVQGASAYNHTNGSGAGMDGRGTGTTGSGTSMTGSTTATSMKPATPPRTPQNQ